MFFLLTTQDMINLNFLLGFCFAVTLLWSIKGFEETVSFLAGKKKDCRLCHCHMGGDKKICEIGRFNCCKHCKL